MARIKGGMNAKKKHNRVLKLAKGYRGASKLVKDIPWPDHCLIDSIE